MVLAISPVRFACSQTVSDTTASAERSPTTAHQPLDADDVRNIVADYLKEEEAKKKRAEEQKKLEDATIGVEIGKDLKTSSIWRDGVHWQTSDGGYKFYVGGRVDYDNTWYAAPESVNRSIGLFNNYFDPNLGLQDGSNFRRARLRFQGTVYEVVEFVCEYDFANVGDLRRRTLGISPPAPPDGVLTDYEPLSGVRFTDLWLGINQLPWLGTFRAGHQKEWISFTNATSGRFLTFIERPAIFDAFNVDFQFSNGFSLQNTYLDERAYWWIGMFRTNSNIGAFGVGDGDYAYDARLTCLPVWLPDDRCWLHVGADFSYRTLHQDRTRFRARPMEFTGAGFQTPSVVNTGTLFSRDGESIVTLEFASASGPWTIASEFAMSQNRNIFLNGLPQPDGSLPPGVIGQSRYNAHGWYVEALYFLTGEHRGYRREQPSYDRIRPHTNFFLVQNENGDAIYGWGGWELGMRYDFLDLSDGVINGGIYHAVTGGINWHLNPNAKVQWNLSWMKRDFAPTDFAGRQEGDFWGFGMRFHWDF
jgi:phosphate-selective porin OprO/OprP